MATPSVTLTPIPTGGAVALSMDDYFQPATVLTASGVTSMTLARATSGVTGLSSFTTLYSGAPQPRYIDVGDCLPGPLIAGSGYVYQVTDGRGTTQVGPVYPAPSLVVMADPLNNMLIRLIQAGINNLTLPGGIKPLQVTTKMPQGGLAALPFIVVNLDAGQQSDTGIGQDVPNVNSATGNDWTIWVNAKRMWRISVLSHDVEERDFYRDAIISIYQVIIATVWNLIGVDKTHDIQFTSGPDANEWEGRIPGFYFADIMVTADGVLNTTVITGYGTIEMITATNTADPKFEATVPLTA